MVDRVIAWSGHDQEGNRVTGRKPVKTTAGFTLASDGTDQSDRFAQQLAAIPDGTAAAPTRVRLPAGSFRMDRTMDVFGRQHLILDGAGAFKTWTDLTGIEAGQFFTSSTGDRSTRNHWRIINSTGVTLQGVDVTGCQDGRAVDGTDFGLYTDALSAEAAFSFYNSTDCVLQDCTFRNPGGDGIYVGGTSGVNRNITIRRVTGEYPGRQSLAVVLVDGLLVEDVDIRRGGRSGLDVEPNNKVHYVWNVTLRRCTMGSKFYPYVVGGTGSLVTPPVKNVLLEDCQGVLCPSNHTAVLATRGGVNITIRRHVDVRQPSQYGLTFAAWNGVTVEGCTVTTTKMTPTSYAVLLQDCTGPLSITDSVFNGKATEGFDQLFQAVGSTTPASVAHHGNVWAMGSLRD